MKELIKKIHNKFLYQTFENESILIINCDCFDLLKEIQEESIDYICIDPPFNTLKHKIETNIDIEKFVLESERILKDNCFMSYFGLQPTLTEWNNYAFKHLKYKSEIIWYKNNITNYLNDICKVYENISIVLKGDKPRDFNQIKRSYKHVAKSLAEFKNWKFVDNLQNMILACINDEELKKQLNKSLKGQKRFDDWRPCNENIVDRSNLLKENREVNRAVTLLSGYKPQNLLCFKPHNVQKLGKNKDFNIKHPTVKPVQLLQYLIALCSNKNDLVFDPFLGSGTTAIACIRENRQFIGCEIFKDYYDISINRLNEELKQKSFNF